MNEFYGINFLHKINGLYIILMYLTKFIHYV